MQRPVEDLYVFNESEVKEPPEGIIGALKYLGPGLILTASIVGSGELIATTTLGATAGFVTLWVIIVSCLVKVTLQLEFGKHAINTGESTMLAMNKLPGPRMGKANWTVWFWVIVMSLKMMQLGGIVGGTALALNIAFPGVSPPIWTWVTALSVALLIWQGSYKFIERACVFMIVCFVLFTIACALFLQATPYRISWADIAEGLQFKLPAFAVGVAIAAFGITGVGGDEIMQYPYWCLEKGYARFTGPKKDTEDWVRRARGWIKVMYVDALFSMVIYTIATIAFYMLGAAVLHGRGTIPQGYDAMRTLATMYTESVGPWAMWVYLIGAIVVLYSTAFSALGAWSRQYTDAFSRIGLLNFSDMKQRQRWIGALAWIIAIIWALLFLAFKAPVFMVILGGIGTSLMLLIVVYAALFFRYTRLDERLRPSRFYDVALWVSAIAIAVLGIRGIIAVI